LTRPRDVSTILESWKRQLPFEAGPEGLAAGLIGEKLDLPPATLSFHLSQLARAGLVSSRQDGRFVIYTASFERMTALVAYLTENCCGGRSCDPAPARPRRTSAKA
jgi:ArsR family transcriptional regulator, arsenate/arsenite/antimonite-responsive transcriptional repressor